jgi:hypothetical protein
MQKPPGTVYPLTNSLAVAWIWLLGLVTPTKTLQRAGIHDVQWSLSAEQTLQVGDHDS